MEEMEILLAEVNELIEAKQYVKLRLLLQDLNPADIAALFEYLKSKEMLLVYRILPKELANEVFVYIDTDKAELLIKSFSDYELKEVVSDLFLDDTVDIIEEMPAKVVARILQAADPAVRQQINELLKYPEDSAGSVMTVEYVSLHQSYTVAEAFKKIRRESINKETLCATTSPLFSRSRRLSRLSRTTSQRRSRYSSYPAPAVRCSSAPLR